MDDDLQVVDDVIEIQDDDDLNDDACQLEVSDQIDFTQDDSNMADDCQGDEIYLEQSNSDFPLEEEDFDGQEENVRTNKTASSNDEDRKQSSSSYTGKSNENKDDFDDLEYDTEEDEESKEEFTDEAEDYEKEYLNMPSLHAVLNDLGSLKQGRRLMAQPLKMEELNHPVVTEIFEKLSSEDIKLQFVRSKEDISEWRGFLLMHFSSCNAAKEAAERLKTIRDDLEVKAQNETAYASKIMEQWIKDEKGQKKWTDALMMVKNIPEGVTVEQLEELFPNCEDVLIVKSHDRNREKSKDAYIMFHDKDQADSVSKETQSSGIEVDGTKLRVYKYHVPHDSGTKGLLKLSQRKMLLKYTERLSEELAKESNDDNYKAPNWCKKRLEACQSALERDDKARRTVGLPTYSYEELGSLGVKSLRSTNRKDSLTRMGIIERPHRKSYHGAGGSNTSRNSSRGGMSSGNRSNRNFQSSNYEHRSFNHNRRSESLLGNPPSLTSMGPIVPPLLALQHNGMIRMMMAQQQQQQRNFESPNMRRGGGREPPAKLLRMDEKGMYHNYRPSGGNSGPNRGRGDKRPISLLDL